ncbi:hypothetical protein BT69DRAFT_1301327 [Atractiella rhizophila]|nr:hypothetical protein BT69DRAFT_1301327 [Atractiella rhizophila]
MPPTRDRACPAPPAGFDDTSSSTSRPKQKNQYSVKPSSTILVPLIKKYQQRGETEGNSLMLINAELAKMKENSISELKGVRIFKELEVLGTNRRILETVSKYQEQAALFSSTSTDDSDSSI